MTTRPKVLDTDETLSDALRSPVLYTTDTDEAQAKLDERVAAFDAAVARQFNRIGDQLTEGPPGLYEAARQAAMIEMLLSLLKIDPTDPWGDIHETLMAQAQEARDEEAVSALMGTQSIVRGGVA